MSGFTGFYDEHISNKDEIIADMGQRIEHRGPDGSGFYTDTHIAMNFRYLDTGMPGDAAQPFHSADGLYVVVFDGTISNYESIRKDLVELHGVEFQSRSDVELVSHAFKVYGEGVAAQLQGSFAFLVYNKQDHSLYGARDYFGVKPFNYAKMGDAFLFGSEIKSFLSHPSFEKNFNKQALKLYLMFQYTPNEETMFKGVYKLKPGTYFTYDGEVFVTKPYFAIDYKQEPMSFEEAVERIKQLVQDSVDRNQVSNAKMGSFLSGGVDSSYIASSVRPMKTYSIGFGMDGFDETELAHELSNLLGMENVRRTISSKEFFEALPRIQYYSDEPHANLSAVPLYFLSSMASKDIRIALSGEGADELFGGYDTYLEGVSDKVYKFLPLSLRKKLASWASDRPYFKGQGFIERNAYSFEDSYTGQSHIMGNEEANEVLSDAYRSDIRFQDITKPYFDQAQDWDDLHKKMYFDMHVWLPYDILLKADRMTMAHSLEVRAPYLDMAVWNFARTLPSEHCVKGKKSKRAFREAALTKIPNEWAQRQKIGFPVPVCAWLREDVHYAQVKELFEQEYTGEIFNQEKLLELLEDHKSEKANNHRKIYTIYAFLLWYEQYFVLA